MQDHESLFGNKPYETTRRIDTYVDKKARALMQRADISADEVKSWTGEAIEKMSRWFGIRAEDIPLERQELTGEQKQHMGLYFADSQTFKLYIDTLVGVSEVNKQDPKVILRRAVFHDIAHAASFTQYDPDERGIVYQNYTTADGVIACELPALAAEAVFCGENWRTRPHHSSHSDMYDLMYRIGAIRSDRSQSQLVYGSGMNHFAGWLSEKFGIQRIAKLATYTDLDDAFRSECSTDLRRTMFEFGIESGLSEQEINEIEWTAEQKNQLDKVSKLMPKEAGIAFSIVEGLNIPMAWKDAYSGRFSPQSIYMFYDLPDDTSRYTIILKPESKQILGVKSQRDSSGANAVFADIDEVREFDSVEDIFSEKGFLRS